MILCLTGFLAAMTLSAQTIQVHGHRGARAMRPENTLPAFEYAIQAGVDALELDLAVTSDNVLVVSHDPQINPKLCDGPGIPKPIHQMTLLELSQWDCGKKKNPSFPNQQPVPGAHIPTLDEVLALAPRGAFRFNIETKCFPDKPELSPPPAEFARLLAAAIEKHHLRSRVIVQSFDFRTLHEMKKLLPDVRLSALYQNGLKDFLAIARESGASIVSPHFSLVTQSRVAEAHQAGLQVVPWTANTPSQWDKLIHAKVDAIITDDPAALIAYLKQKGLR
ncbi:MAG: glycerophosphodiester phosphodiesterase [Bryobacterales bacterium]|nr:glycerophosphodiester phosphodiesterase [Bryobacterales bacterium]